MLSFWQLQGGGGGGGSDSCRDIGSEVNYKSADRTEQGHRKIDALCC